MKRNVGRIDRNIRIVVGVVLLIAGLAIPMATLWRVVVLVVAAVALVTAGVGFCPANALLGIDTAKDEGGK